eukprot:11167923-Lingulodinium_polyedra.AAC.1
MAESFRRRRVGARSCGGRPRPRKGYLAKLRAAGIVGRRRRASARSAFLPAATAWIRARGATARKSGPRRSEA